MDYESFLSILSVTATFSTFVLFLCGLQICSRIRQRGSTDGTGVAPFLLTSISCVCWLGYGIIREDSTVIFVNGVGLAVQTLYLAYYYLKTRLKVDEGKKSFMTLRYSFVATLSGELSLSTIAPIQSRLNRLIAIELFVCVLTTWIVSSEHIALNRKLNVLGMVCLLLNIATIASPLADLGQVLRTKSSESVPFFLCVANMGCSLQWLLYGWLVDDFYMKVPNAVGTLLSAVQLSLFIIYPSNSYKILSVSSSSHNMHKNVDNLL